MAKTYDQCVDHCETTYVDGVAFDLCLDGCDQQFAAGREPSGNVLDLMRTLDDEQ